MSLSVLPLACQSTDLYRFDRVVIDQNAAGVFDLNLADIDGDGLVDIVAVSNDPAQLAWYKNPSWDRYIVTRTIRENIAVAPYDIDGDGDTDLVLAGRSDNGADDKDALLQWFENPGLTGQVQEWRAYTIDQLAAPYRLQWLSIANSGRKVLVSLSNIDGSLLAYPIPRNPVENWQSVSLGKISGAGQDMLASDYNLDGKDELLVANSSGVDMLQFATEEQSVLFSRIDEGADGRRQSAGSAQASLGNLSNEQLLIASIEPSNASEVVVYTLADRADTSWQRRVIDDSLQTVHALQLVDINNDGVDELFVGSDAIYTYRYDEALAQWQRSTKASMAADIVDIEAADINGDGRSDLVTLESAGGPIVLLQSVH